MFVEQKAATSQLVQAEKYKCKCKVFHSFIVGTSRLRTPLHDLVFPVSQNHIFCKASPAKPGSESGLLALYSKGSEYRVLQDIVLCLMLLRSSPLESSTRKLEDYSSKCHLFQLGIQPKATRSRS